MTKRSCDICGSEHLDVVIDGRTASGRWAWLCESCHTKYGVGLGTGCGQKYEWKNGQYVKVEG